MLRLSRRVEFKDIKNDILLGQFHRIGAVIIVNNRDLALHYAIEGELSSELS